MAFFSCKHLLQEINYEIYDKKLLAIIKSFKEWCLILEGAELPIKILTNHRICNISYLQNSYLAIKHVR